MDVDITQSEQWLRFLAWLEDNWRRVAGIGLAVIGIGVVVSFVLWQGGQKQRSASEALSMLLIAPEACSGDALLGFADEHTGTEAGKRALLLAAGTLFTEGRFPEAQHQFERFLAEHSTDPAVPQARFGLAACREAQGHVESAVTGYRAIVESRASGGVLPLARFALANLYAQQGQHDLARAAYEELANVRGSTLAAEARARLAELPPGPASRPMTVPSVTPLTPPEGQP